MEGFHSWIESNWFSVLQTIGILGSLWFTAAYFRQDSKSRQVSNILALVERHRVLWTDAHQREDLKRIFSDRADILARPPTIAEDEFLRLVILHFETGWRLERNMDRNELKALAQDAGEFFSLPLPHAIWEKTKRFRNQKFVAFVEQNLKKC